MNKTMKVYRKLFRFYIELELLLEAENAKIVQLLIHLLKIAAHSKLQICFSSSLLAVKFLIAIDRDKEFDSES